jgi:cell division protein FtsI/penicillin-binding protein 2
LTNRIRRIKAGLRVALALAAGGSVLSACSTGSTGPTGMIQRYLAAWSEGNYGAMATLVSHPPKNFVDLNRQVATDLGLTKQTHELGTVSTSGSAGTADVTNHLTLGSLGTLRVRSTLELTDSSGSWKVQWSPRLIIPSLGTGDSVKTTLSWPPRASIDGMGGASLTTSVPMVSVGIEGSRVTNGAALSTALAQIGIPADQIQAAQATAMAHPTWFVPVTQLTEAAYEQDKPLIYPVPGTVFNSYSARGALTPELAAHVVGTVGPITAQEIETLGPPYATGDIVGQSGIEQAYERQLAGTPGAVVTVVNHSGDNVALIGRFAQRAATPVQTTIDPTVQEAAESALSGQTLPAAIVAMQASTGAVLASVSTPDSEGVNEAFDGAYPPGSTFKVVTSSDLIEHGATPSSPATCPASITVNGEVFHNFEGETTASLSMEQAFAMSCNTAFIGLAGSLPDASFTSTAAQFGVGSKIQMGLTAFGGRAPTPTSTSDAAATAIGQAQVVVSPLSMANVAASVDSGSLRLPQLVSGSPDDAQAAEALNPSVVADLRTMMNAVVTSPIGTAAAAGLPSGTFGKTGTAEFGTANPPQTDAWFIGYNGDLAFAVLVVGGGVGGTVAAPIAAKLLSAAGNVP